MNSKEVMIGDQIVCRGQRITINEIISQDNYGRNDQDDWYIEFRDKAGNYRYWKQQCDGGELIRITSAQPVDEITYISTEYSNDETVAFFKDGSQLKYIVVEHGMIFVDSHEPREMRRLIEDTDYEPEEAYDTIDSVNYYSKSKYADLIDTALLQTVNYLFSINK